MADRRVQDLLRALEAPGALRSTRQMEEADARHTNALARYIERVPRRRHARNLTRATVASAIAMAGMAAGWWLAVPRGGSLRGEVASSEVEAVDGRVWVRRGAAAFAAAPGQALRAADRVELERGATSTIKIAQRTEVELSSRAVLELTEVNRSAERLHLAAGSG